MTELTENSRAPRALSIYRGRDRQFVQHRSEPGQGVRVAPFLSPEHDAVNLSVALVEFGPGGQVWGHRHAFGGPFSPLGPGLFPGMEPAGDYPIHIIVKNMRVTLVGVVDNDGDKTIAEMKARQVPGSFEVKNELMVEKTSSKSTSSK